MTTSRRPSCADDAVLTVTLLENQTGLLTLARRPARPRLILHQPPPGLTMLIGPLGPDCKQVPGTVGRRRRPRHHRQRPFGVTISQSPYCAPEGRLAVAEVFETTDVDVAEQILSSSYANTRIDARGQRGGLKVTRSGLGPSARLGHNQWTLTFDITAGTPLGALAIGYLRDGQGC